MAVHAFATAEIEDGTGKSTALVYEDTSATIAYLDDRNGGSGTSVLSTKTADQQKSAMINGTDAAENAIRPYFRGLPRTDDQNLLFPSDGAIGSQRGTSQKVFDTDETPSTYLEGVRELVELSADGKLWPTSSPDRAMIKSTSRRGHRVEFRDASVAGDLASLHPGVFRRLRTALPRVEL